MPDEHTTPDSLRNLERDCADTSTPDKRFTVKSWGEVLAAEIAPQEGFFGDCFFTLGQIQAIFGQGGLGKSRIALNLARNNVLGFPFLGHPTGQPLCHLFMGNENDIHRWKKDMTCMSKGLGQNQIDALSANIHVTTLERPEDSIITLAAPDAKERWSQTISSVNPAVLWLDPWGAVMDGDTLSETDVRSTLQTVLQMTRHTNPKCAVVILAHARTGLANIEQAVGFDAANFGKDSKALYSAARAVVNLAPYDESEHPDLVFVFAKNNNGPKPKPLRIQLDPDTLTYSEAGNIEIQTWRESIRATRRPLNRQAQKLPFDERKALEIAATPMTKGEFVEALCNVGMTRDSAKNGAARLLRENKLRQVKHGRRNGHLIGTPEALQREGL